MHMLMSYENFWGFLTHRFNSNCMTKRIFLYLSKTLQKNTWFLLSNPIFIIWPHESWVAAALYLWAHHCANVLHSSVTLSRNFLEMIIRAMSLIILYYSGKTRRSKQVMPLKLLMFKDKNTYQSKKHRV